MLSTALPSAALALLAAATPIHSARAQGWHEGRIFACASAVKFEVGGETSPQGRPATQPSTHQFTFDEATGRLHWVGTSITWQFRVVQKGDATRSLRAVRTFDGPATSILETIHIATWESPEIDVVRNGSYPFLYNNDGIVYAGLCRIG